MGLEGRSTVTAKTRSRPYKATERKSTRGFILDSWAKAIRLIKSMATGAGLSPSFLPECHSCSSLAQAQQTTRKG